MTADESTRANDGPSDESEQPHGSADVETTVAAESSRAPIADVGTRAFDGVDVYAGDDVFETPPAYDGASVYTAEPSLGVADPYEAPGASDPIGAYEPDGAYAPTVTPVTPESIVPEGATPTADGSEPARVDPIGVYVPEDVPAAALPQTEIADAESAASDVSVEGAEPLPGTAVAPETGEPVTPPDATSGPNAVRFDD